ncbi:MAG: hypothetical protein A2X31_00510 [Elusimicrobia bacterium GWB2_63_22]|nr:MAG: hypothetical protein A2X31_00510 [Elusimicrobia bacterium GWB2_63_22]
MTPEQFTSDLKAACGDNLLSLVLYGSAAAGDAVPGKSGANTLAVLKTCGPADLKAAAAGLKGWLKSGNPAPVMFSREQLLTSADTFPIELADMKDFHRVLYGEDILPAITIKPHELRLAVERELKGKLLRLREACLRAGGDRKTLTAVLAGFSSEMLVLCRAALRLKAGKVPATKLECARELKKHAAFDAEAFAAADALRRGEKPAEEIAILFDRFLGAAAGLSAAVDSWDVAK